MTIRSLTCILVLAVISAPLAAHDYWLQPETFFPKPGDVVAIRLYVGDHFKVESERPFQKKPTIRFQLISAKETLDLAAKAEEDQKPAAKATLRDTGNYVVALERGPTTIKLEADKFNKYLAEEGLDAILAERKQAGEEKTPGRERYSRFIKALVQAGDKRDGTCEKTLGHRLEIVPQANPYTCKPGDSLKILVLFEGKPLGGAKVFALHQADEKVTTQTAISAKDGTATFKLEKAGVWLLRLVHMRRVKGEEEVDWESFWTSCTFGMK